MAKLVPTCHNQPVIYLRGVGVRLPLKAMHLRWGGGLRRWGGVDLRWGPSRLRKCFSSSPKSLFTPVPDVLILENQGKFLETTLGRGHKLAVIKAFRVGGGSEGTKIMFGGCKIMGERSLMGGGSNSWLAVSSIQCWYNLIF